LSLEGKRGKEKYHGGKVLYTILVVGFVLTILVVIFHSSINMSCSDLIYDKKPAILKTI